MGKSEAATWGCCNLITYSILLIFTAISLGTYSWGVAIYEITDQISDCTADVDWYIGLEKQYRSFDGECSGESDEDVSDFDCDNLTDSQCDYLNGARDNAAFAVTCSVLLVILFILVMIGVRKPNGRIVYVLIIAALIMGVVMLSTAFAAATAYQNLIDDLNEDSNGIDMSAGYSLNLMMAAGVIGIPALGVSIATVYYYSKADEPDGLTATLTDSEQKQDINNMM